MADDIRRRNRVSGKGASGRFLLRFRPGLHDLLREAAREAGLSLNDYCNLKLAAPAGRFIGEKVWAEIVARAAAAFGAELRAVAAFGSWSRGEAGASSDLDLLIVIESRRRIDRSLYRQWDREEGDAGEWKLDPHFVHPPAAEGAVSSLWAEVAVEGILLFERGFELSKVLVRVRREILEGRLLPKWIHGQRYWVEVA